MKHRNKSRVGSKVCSLLFVAQLITAFAQAETINAGPFRLSVGLTAGAEFDDNINASEHNPKTEFSLVVGPFIGGSIELPITLPGGQKLSMNTSVSYTYKLSLTGNSSSTFDSPISATLVLPMRIEEWIVVAGDAFNFSNEPLESTFAVNRSKAPQYNNTASISATRQMGRFALTLAGSRTDKIFPDDPFLEEVQYQFSVTPAFYIRENYSVFWRNSFGLVFPKELIRQDTIGWASEVGLSGQITPYLSGSISIGFAHSHLEEKTVRFNQDGIFGGIFDEATIPADNIDGITSTLALNYSHPLRPNTTYQISFFRSPGVTAVLENSNITETYGATLNIQHRLTSSLTLTPSIQWVHLKDVGRQAVPGLVGAGSGEEADIVALQLGLTRILTRHLTSTFTYRYQARSSNLDNSSYDDNHVTWYINYTF